MWVPWLWAEAGGVEDGTVDDDAGYSSQVRSLLLTGGGIRNLDELNGVDGWLWWLGGGIDELDAVGRFPY